MILLSKVDFTKVIQDAPQNVECDLMSIYFCEQIAIL